MSEPANRILNPMLALLQLYKKDGKNFQTMIADVTARLGEIGIPLESEYIKDKVLPWILSFLFMSTGQQMLEEYIQNLASLRKKDEHPKGPPTPPPAGMN